VYEYKMNILKLLILLDVFLKFKHMYAYNKDVIKNIVKISCRNNQT